MDEQETAKPAAGQGGATEHGRVPLLTAGFRPFFLAAGVWAGLAMLIWIGVMSFGAPLPSRFDPLAWHVHEMLFGFVPAAVAGFLLTAVANWTGRAPVRGITLAVLALLWLGGRVANLTSAYLPSLWAPAIDIAFMAVLGVVVARELVLAGNRRNLVLLLPLAVLAAGSLLMHLAALGTILPDGLGWRLGIAAMALLIAIIGGRIVPAFTRNWLVARGSATLPAPSGSLDRLALVALLVAVTGWAVAPAWRPAGVLLMVAGALGLVRLARWRGVAVRGETLLLVLHIGLAWLAGGLALLGLSVLSPAIPLAAGVHALTAGAMGTMILAVMTRATLGHTGHGLHAGPVTVAMYGLVTTGAILRVWAAFAGGSDLLFASGTLWAASYLLFAVSYGPILLATKRTPTPPPARQ